MQAPKHSQQRSLSPAETARYSRHIILPEVGLAGQERLAASRVLIVGMGGLGSPAALYLAAAGVGTLGLADYDAIEEHNLQRQILHSTDGVGKSKIESAIARLKALNPFCQLRTHTEGVTVANAVALIDEYDLVVDGSDNFPTRYLVNDAAFFAGRPLIYGSIFQFEGQVSVFDPRSGGPCYRCLFPRMPDPDSVPNCEEAGVFGALPGVVGSLQALEAIKYLLKIGETLSGRLMVIETLSMNTRTLLLKKDCHCPLCGDTPQITEISAPIYEFSCLTEEAVGDASDSPLEVTVGDTKQLLDSGRKVTLLDVREPFEVAICRIDGSLHVPMRAVAENLSAFPRDEPTIVYCHTGMRSLHVARFLREHGVKEASSMAGGIQSWADEIDPGMARY